MTVRFRSAKISDALLLAYWDELPHVKASDPTSDWEWENELKENYEWRELWIAEVKSQPVGVLQIIDPSLESTNYWNLKQPGYKAIDIWIGPPEFLNKGYGTQMMKTAIKWCFEQEGIHTILIDPLLSNTSAHRFYQRLGFVPLEERWFEKDLCLVHELKKESN